MSTVDPILHLAIPKGRMYDGVVQLLNDAGIRLHHGSRGYRPKVSLPSVEAKLLKPQNIVEMLSVGTRDLGFAGADWVAEKSLNLHEILDTGMDEVRIVVAAPREIVCEGPGGRTLLPPESPMGGPLRVASELERLTKGWIQKSCPKAVFVRTYGATEVFPPEDADVIVDITQTGVTLEANGLVIVDEIMVSSTRLFASGLAMDDPLRRNRIEDITTLLRSVLSGRQRVMLELNVPSDRLDVVVDALPAMRLPTISKLHTDPSSPSVDGYAVRAAVLRSVLPSLVPELKARGGSDIVVSPLSQVVP
ncbi:MAG: ATP phosphoribosyltransferase [Myxococcales bacterium]|nr:ATP phosphoribosyltransferase [Myxococcales bacterium]